MSIRLGRREWLRRAGCGFGALACDALAFWSQQGRGKELQQTATANPLAVQVPHFQPRAKRVIFLYMHGGASHIDTFDHKPELRRQHGKQLPKSVNTGRNKFNQGLGTIMQSPWKFKRYGESGGWASELFPHVGQCMDDLCLLRSMYSNNNAHVPATLELHTGSQTFMRPSVGAWVTYGLGTENENLPGFITICPPLTYGGQRNFGSAFLPAAFQGTMVGTNRVPVSQARLDNIRPSLNGDQQRDILRFVAESQKTREEVQGGDAELEARVASFELAFRMQSAAPEAMQLQDESAETHQLYGIDDPVTENYGRELLLARRFVERGVRFVHVAHTGGRGGRWDQHSDLQSKHEENARSCDKPIAGLLADLKRRGLLDETLVVWATEFGRTPEVQNKTGRGHHAQGFTFWLAGGGVKGGFRFGETDEFGYHAVRNPINLADLHATILHLLGLDHKRLTYRYSGRDFRLTDVRGQVVQQILV